MLLQSSQRFGFVPSRVAIWSRWFLASIVIALSVFSLVVSVFLPHAEVLLKLPDLSWKPHNLFSVCLLIILGVALVRGKRHAWGLASMMTAHTVLLMIVQRSYGISLIINVAALLMLLCGAPLFTTRSDPRFLLPGYIALGLSALCLLYIRSLPPFLAHSIPLPFVYLGARLLLVYGFLTILRPMPSLQQAPNVWERIRAWRVLSRNGELSMGHFTLTGDKRYFWSNTGRSFLAYQVLGGVALVLGDPIGPPEEHGRILAAFFAHCQRQDWSPTFYQASSRTVQLCSAWGFKSFHIGEEAVVDLSSFTLQGKRGAPVRHAIARAKRGGITVQCWQGEPVPAPIFEAMQDLSRCWLQEQQIVEEFGFSMGRFPADWSPNLLTVVACDASGKLQAFLTWTPLYAGRGWALDVMRRSHDTVPGTMEYVIATAFSWAKEHGAQRMSLGLAPLARTMSPSDAQSDNSSSLLERLAISLHQRGLLLGQYRSLHSFKSKFQPVWDARYIIIPKQWSMLRALYALAGAHGYTWKWLLKRMISPRFSLKLARKIQSSSDS